MNLHKDYIKLKQSYINLIRNIDFSSINIHEPIIVKSPLRVNFSAGWNDTPPYCNEISGYTLNAPILFNNNYPVEVIIKKISAKKLIFKNIDTNTSISITNMSQLIDCQSPEISFALHKCSILASGLVPFNKDYNLNNLFDKIGGFELSTSVKDIPLGSGLGTSSILIFNCIKAIYNFLGIDVSNLDLFNMTTCAELILTTGGGYQDQIGAYSKNFKFISFAPGIYPKINCENIELDLEFQNELQSRTAFIFTGKTRASKNSLKTIMNNYISKDTSTIKILKEIGIIAKNMKVDLISKNIDSFACNMIKSFNLNVALNPSFTNKTIDDILYCLNDYIIGYMLSGAGNGGFLTVILKKGISKYDIEKKLNSYFKDSNIKTYNFNLFF